MILIGLKPRVEGDGPAIMPGTYQTVKGQCAIGIAGRNAQQESRTVYTDKKGYQKFVGRTVFTRFSISEGVIGFSFTLPHFSAVTVTIKMPETSVERLYRHDMEDHVLAISEHYSHHIAIPKDLFTTLDSRHASTAIEDLQDIYDGCTLDLDYSPRMHGGEQTSFLAHAIA